MKNYGQIKLALVQKGLFIPDEVRKASDVACGVCVDQQGEEITLALAEDFIVKAQLKPVGRGCAKLSIKQGNACLVTGQERIAVDIIPLPNFLRTHQDKRTPIAGNSCLDGYCLNIFLRALKQKNRLNLTQDTILSLIQSAFAEGAADLVQLNMDHCNQPDGGFTRLVPLIGEIKKKFSTFVALRGFPPQDEHTLDKIYAAGIDLLNFPLEGFTGSKKSKGMFSDEEVYRSLEYAAGIFPEGAVWTELLCSGSVQVIKEKIDRLTQKGILPFIKLQPVSMASGDEYKKVEEAARHLEAAVQRHKIPLKWLYPACRFVTPLDTRFFTDGSESARLSAKPVYKSKLGKKASEGFAFLRRKLRIKNLSDSYESAGL
ncbi:MAG: hypothetical protein V3U37_03465 [Nitrospinaceae bacterium]